MVSAAPGCGRGEPVGTGGARPRRTRTLPPTPPPHPGTLPSLAVTWGTPHPRLPGPASTGPHLQDSGSAPVPYTAGPLAPPGSTTQLEPGRYIYFRPQIVHLIPSGPSSMFS